MQTSFSQPKLRARKCKCGCGQTFTPRSSLHTVAGMACAVRVTEARLEKEDRRRDAERRQKLKTRSEWLAEAQAVFNKWVRKRDEKEPCISCGCTQAGQWDAGHYLSRGSNPALRFHEDNVHKQCSTCNDYLSGNAVKFRAGLIRKIGLERVEWLEGPHELAKFKVEDAKAIKATYKAKLKELE